MAGISKVASGWDAFTNSFRIHQFLLGKALGARSTGA